MSPALLDLYQRNQISWDDVFELYAQMCIDQTRDMTQNILEDAGLDSYIKQVGEPTVVSLTAAAVDWANNGAPDMVGDMMMSYNTKTSDETWLQFCIRASIEKRVKETGAFKLKLS